MTEAQKIARLTEETGCTNPDMVKFILSENGGNVSRALIDLAQELNRQDADA